MYSVGIEDFFVAQHSLTVEAPVHEKIRHSHHYRIQLEFKGTELGNEGYLIDIDEAKAALLSTVAYFQDKYLNELPEFSGKNPSIEHFSKIISQRILSETKGGWGTIKVTLWEDKIAWASFSKEL